MDDLPGGLVDDVADLGDRRSVGVAGYHDRAGRDERGSRASSRNVQTRSSEAHVAHQLKQPDEVAALAGTEWVLERAEQTQTLGHTGLASQRAGNRYVVHPDDIAASIEAKPSSSTARKRSS